MRPTGTYLERGIFRLPTLFLPRQEGTAISLPNLSATLNHQLVTLFADLVNGADVRMIEGGRRTRLSVETLQSPRVSRQIVGKKLQRNEAAKLSVLSFINNAHAAAPELLEDAVVRDGLADERVRTWHLQHILGCARKQVNKDRLLTCQRQDSVGIPVASRGDRPSHPI